MKKVALVFLCFLSLSHAKNEAFRMQDYCENCESKPANSFIFGLGTNGLGLGFKYNAADHFSLRMDLSGFYAKLNVYDDGENIMKYQTKTKMLNFGIYGDLFPCGNNFYLSGGAMVGKNEIAVRPVANGSKTIRLQGKDYQFSGDNFIEIRLKFPAVRPYFGIGYADKNHGGFGFNTNLGFAYGKLTSEVKYSSNLAAIPGFDEAIEKKREDNQDKIKIRFYPIVNFNLTYSF